MRTVRDIKGLENSTVLVRAALNVPVENGSVINTFRLRAALPTIEYLRKRHARVVLISHITGQGTETLKPMWEAMQPLVPGISFCPVTVGAKARDAVRNLPAGGVLMLENLRRNAGEQANDPAFAAELANLGDVFVQDCFDVCHRNHASVVGVPKLLSSYAGLLVEREVDELTKALKPKKPSLAVIGGAKFSTKEPVLKKLLKAYDRVFVGGALANDFIQAAGHAVGTSLTSDADPRAIQELLANKRVMIPSDVMVAPYGAQRAQGRVVSIDAVAPGDSILDAGPETMRSLTACAQSARTILWNGPLGHYENGFVDGTHDLAAAIAKSSAYSILGGGDTVAAVEALGLAGDFSFISTGGGAMLDFLAQGTLPGIDALR